VVVVVVVVVVVSLKVIVWVKLTLRQSLMKLETDWRATALLMVIL
jgi:hypothetical protein